MDSPQGFDRIAGIYDLLASLVFGGSIKKSQTYFLSRIPDQASILVIGGGTGWWLNEFLAQRPNCRIVFVDLSREMVRLAKKEIRNDPRVSFRQGSEDTLYEVAEFDVVITFYFLDLFSESELATAVGKIFHALKREGLWLATDFVEARWWHGAMLGIMYMFFRITTGLSNQRLPDWDTILRKSSLRPVSHCLFYAGFIRSAMYQAP